VSTLRTKALSLGVAAVAFGATAGPAAASNVVIEVQIQAKIFQKDKALKGLEHVHPRTKAEVRKLIPKYHHLERRFRTAATAVAHSTANNAAQRTGRTQWVSGARTFADGVHEFDNGLTALLKNKPARAKRLIAAADRRLTQGDKELAKANRTLSQS
jgi:hypothetical protein